MAATYSEFGRELLEGLPPKERRDRLAELEALITDRLSSRAIWDDYWQEVEHVISDLKSAGHDLWSHGSDGERRHLWGWDYMRPNVAGYLQIQFDHIGPVKTFWRTENPRLATEDDD